MKPSDLLAYISSCVCCPLVRMAAYVVCRILSTVIKLIWPDLIASSMYFLFYSSSDCLYSTKMALITVRPVVTEYIVQKNTWTPHKPYWISRS